MAIADSEQQGRFDSVQFTYLAMSEDYLNMDINLYSLMEEDDQTTIDEIVTETLARHFGTEQLDQFEWNFKCTRKS